MSAKKSVNVNEITFGIEIEMVLPNDAASRHGIHAGPYHRGYSLPREIAPTGWTAQRDASLESGYGQYPVEIVSPVLRGLSGLNEVVEVIENLNRIGADVNTTCGIHVHVGVAELVDDTSDFDEVAHFCNKLTRLTNNHEAALFAMGNRVSRLRNTYCHSLKSAYEQSDFEGTKKQVSQKLAAKNSYHMNRYRTLNLESLFSAGRTVEFRVFAATLNVTKIVGYVLTALGLAHKAATLSWTKKFEDRRSTSNYRQELDDLHCKLNWATVKESGPKGQVKYGFADGAWDKFGDAVVKNQRWNADRFDTNAPRCFA